MRAAIYARYSDPRQNPSSIRDQIDVCRKLAAREGYDVVEVYADPAISGAVTINRPAFLNMMADARRGHFTVVIMEALDRFSRGQADVAAAFEDLAGWGVALHTISEGLVDELHIGLKGTMNALQLKEIGAKTRRGQAGVVGEGRAITTPYGYRVVRKIGPTGEVIVGLREIDPVKAEVVRRVFSDYAAGLSPTQIVKALNTEGVPAPRGGAWRVTRLNQPAKGLLYNELYRGVMVWGRTVSRKDRSTGQRKHSAAAGDLVVRVDRPDLRIVEDDVWFKAQAMLKSRSAASPQRAQAQRRPKRLLSGLVVCGTCGGHMTLQTGQAVEGAHAARFRCNNRVGRGTAVCTNARTVVMVEAERRVIAAVRDQLLRPEMIDAVVREVHRLSAERNRTAVADRDRLQRELAEVRRKAGRLVDQVADGALSGETVGAKIRELETRAEQVQRDLDRIDDAGKVVAIHPAAAGHYRAMLEDLGLQLNGTGAAEVAARESFRQLIGKVRVIPLEARGQYELEVVGRMQSVMALVAGKAIVDGGSDDLGEYRISG